MVLHTVRKAETRDIAIEIKKMRGTNHSRKMHPFKITEKGVIVFPNQPVYQQAAAQF